MSEVRLKHPDSKTRITVQADAAPMYESQGWQRVEAPAKKAAAKKAPPA